MPANEKSTWTSLRDAAKVLGITKEGVLFLRCTSFRVEQYRNESSRELRWYVNVNDLERERLRRMGPRDYQLEREVLAALREGRSIVDVMERLPFVTLSDLERIQQQHARVIGTIVLDGQQSQELALLLGIDGVISAESIVRSVRSVCARLDRVVGELHSPKPLPQKATEEEKPNGEHQETSPP